MHRAYDPGDTIRVNSKNCGRITNELKREMENGVSRSSLVHGTQTNPNSDTWYDTDAFLLDQVKEVLNKLSEGSIDDEIWGKIVIMERCKRVAKAYLRKTTIIIDGSEDEFDGKTLGFNHFDNPTRDEYTNEIRGKIADGVILKMDYQGNIKGMARGATPIICQGWKDTRTNCISDRLVRLHGKLNHGSSEDEKAYKVFDMRKFKNYLEREMHDGTPDARTLLLKTCMRIALVKDAGDMNRTPCWFAIVNLVALDMVKEKIPMVQSILNGNTFSTIPKNIPSASSNNDGIDTQTLTQIIAAAVTQANKGISSPNQTLPISPEQLAQIASTISIAQTNTMRTADLTTISKKDRKKVYHCSTSSLDSSGEENRRADLSVVKNRAKRWEADRGCGNMEKNLFEKNRTNRSNRPLLQDAIFTRSQSITSDYDSNKEHFDSGSWSSTQSNYKDGRSTASSIISDQEFSSSVSRNEMKGTTEIKEANSTSEDEETNYSPTPILPKNENNIAQILEQHAHFAPTKETPIVSPIPEETSETCNSTPPIEHDLVKPPPLPRTPQPDGGSASQLYNNTFKMQSPYYQQQIDMKQPYEKQSKEMEVYFGRTTIPSDTQANRPNRFVNELRQVLQRRAGGINRNHSQPAAVHPNLRQFTSHQASSGRNTPDRSHFQMVPENQMPRGLRRFNEPSARYQQAVRTRDYSSNQGYQQSTMCRDQSSAIRVNRTGSLPWSQWQHARKTHM